MAGLHRLPKILARGKPRCPVCTREVPRGFIRPGTFSCPWCKEPLRFLRISKLKAIPIELCGVALAFLVLWLAGLEGNALLLGMIILFAPAGLAACAFAGAPMGYFFPRLERDPGWDDGDFLHIVPPRDRHED
jgi:hypothetical protein